MKSLGLEKKVLFTPLVNTSGYVNKLLDCMIAQCCILMHTSADLLCWITEILAINCCTKQM